RRNRPPASLRATRAERRADAAASLARPPRRTAVGGPVPAPSARGARRREGAPAGASPAVSAGLRGPIAGAPGRLASAPAAELGDLSATWRVVPISLAAVAIGLLSACVALALLRLIGLFTNLFFFQRWDFALVSPAGNRLGAVEILVPVAGALIVGFMARYGSDRIRGHGIPEALESILIRGSRVEPRVALLKPLSAAISIGSGGPFGAEAPIIMTGGAVGPPGGGPPPLPHRARAALSHPAASALHRSGGPARLCARRTGCRRAVRDPDGRGLRGGGCLHPAPDPLDVVAGARRPGGRA